MFRLAHLSDIHLGPLPDVGYLDLVSKRITGYINWHRNRAGRISQGVLERIVASMQEARPDHVAVTGDLMNLALDEEIDEAREWLTTLGDPAHVSVVPGNHDAYVPGALRKAARAWRAWKTGEDGWATRNDNGYPYVRVRGPLAIVGVSSALATAPFLASGDFSSKQAKRMGAILSRAGAEGLCRVVLIHHPPVRGADPAHKRLYGIGTFQETLCEHGAELVLHGHTHLATLNWIGGRDRPVPVVGVAAAGEGHGGEKPLAQYNLIDVDGAPGQWRLRLSRHGLTAPDSPVTRLSVEDLVPPGERRGAPLVRA